MIKREANHERWHPLPPGIFEDARLSYKALGLLCYLLSRPDDWEVRRSHLVSRQEKDGKSSVQSALKELVDAGYARLEPIYDPATKQLSGQRYVVSDFPRDRKPVSLENRGTENLVNRKPGQQESGPLTYSGSSPSIEKRLKTEKREERAREDFETGEAEGEEWVDKLPDVQPVPFQRRPFATVPVRLPTENADPVDNGQCAYPDPAFSCPHEQLALQAATEILGRPVKKSHRHLHAWVHEHSIADTTKVLEHFVANEPDRAKWTLGLIFAPDNAEARLQAATSPPPKLATKEAADQDRPLRHAAYKPFEDAPTLPEDALPREDAKALVSDLMKQFNAREM